MFALNRKIGAGYLSKLIKQQKDVSEIVSRSKSSCVPCLNQQRLLINNKNSFQYQTIRNKS
jgi:hypothetical protein